MATIRRQKSVRDAVDLAYLRKPEALPKRPTYDADHFRLTMLWNADPALARRADAAGVDRIGLDLETIGKAERQKGLGTWVSQHREEQLADLREAVGPGRLFCRTNPIHPGSRAEIERLLAFGVDTLMLPMFRTPEEVERFVAYVDGRAEAVVLLEHCDAAARVEQIVRVPGIDHVHVGLTDLALSLNVKNRFGLMATPLLDRIAAAVHGEGLRLAIGGIGRAMDVSQPVPTDLVYAQYPRLGATGALVSRAFFGKDPEAVDLAAEVRRCRERFDYWRRRSPEALDAAREQFVEKVTACQRW